MLRILIVEDDPDVSEAVVDALVAAGHDVVALADGAAAVAKISAESFDAIVTDVRIPHVDGLGVFRHARRVAPRAAVVLMSSYGNVVDAVTALKEGASDYLTKPFDVDELTIRLAAVDAKRTLEKELDAARARLAGAADGVIVGASPEMLALLDRLAAVADSDVPVLVTGETGTGKELVARRIHSRSDRHARPFVPINCAGFPETLLEAELFGHERGAFTGATKKRDGRFKAADGGTLFLDEVAEMPMTAQVKLLRVLQEGEIVPLGSNTPVRVDVRVVSATHRDLRKRIADGLFREDLFYRLDVVRLHIPPLRERPGDLPLLLNHFLEGFLPPGAPMPSVSVRAWQALSSYPFPGNVRELAHAVQHAVVLSRRAAIDVEHLPPDVVSSAAVAATGDRSVQPLAVIVKQAERAHIVKALAIADGKRSLAADLLGISRKNLWEKLRAHGISDSDVDDPAT